MTIPTHHLIPLRHLCTAPGCVLTTDHPGPHVPAADATPLAVWQACVSCDTEGWSNEALETHISWLLVRWDALSEEEQYTVLSDDFTVARKGT